MSLDLYFERVQPCQVFSSNITHNLTSMADAVGLYGLLWRPEENGNPTAGQLIEPIEKAIAELEANPEKYNLLNPSNGWGSRTGFVRWLREVLESAREYPDATVRASR